jgi:hypothetical protein
MKKKNINGSSWVTHFCFVFFRGLRARVVLVVLWIMILSFERRAAHEEAGKPRGVLVVLGNNPKTPLQLQGGGQVAPSLALAMCVVPV